MTDKSLSCLNHSSGKHHVPGASKSKSGRGYECYLFCQRVETTTQNSTTFTQDEIVLQVEQPCVNYMHCFH